MTGDEWRQRLAEQLAARQRRRAARAAIRRELDERRRHGLAERHRQKLQRATRT